MMIFCFPSRGDTAMVLSVTIGVHIGSWTNFQLGIMREPSLSPPYAILWPSFEMMGMYNMYCNENFLLVNWP